MANKVNKTVDIIIPVYYGNLFEIDESIKKQVVFYSRYLKEYDWKIIIGINGLNKNNIIEEVKNICEHYGKKVTYDYDIKPGKGISVKKCIMQSNADIVSFMDVDLATDLKDFPKLLKLIEKYDFVSGSRYLKGSAYERKFLRTFISKFYLRYFVKGYLNIKSTDPQCGFKAMKTKIARIVIEIVEDDEWFFETEMMGIAEMLGCLIKEIPVSWKDNNFSGVNILKAIPYFIKASIKLKKRLNLING